MDVIYERVAGLDVHKQTVVATVRAMVAGKVERECRTFDTTTAGGPTAEPICRRRKGAGCVLPAPG